MKNNRRFAFVFLFIFILSQGLVLGDEVKRNIFDLGFFMGRPGSEGLRDQDLLVSDSRIMQNVRDYVGRAVKTAEELGIPTDSLNQFLANCENFTRSQYMTQGRQMIDFLQNSCRNMFGETGAVIFTIGVWMGGAQNLSEFARQYSRVQRPGTYALIQRNVGWMQQNAPVVELSVDRINRLGTGLNTPTGLPFGGILNDLEAVLDQWRRELLGQPGFPVTSVVTDSNWNAEVMQAGLPVLVVFGASFNPQSARLIKTVKGMANKYKRKVKFVTADPKDCPKTFGNERIMNMPVMRIYFKGQMTGELTGNQTEENISKFIDENLGQPGILGIEMARPVIKKKIQI
ncbi:thioredoxin family protein [Acidobacteriota bacterium]